MPVRPVSQQYQRNAKCKEILEGIWHLAEKKENGRNSENGLHATSIIKEKCGQKQKVTGNKSISGGGQYLQLQARNLQENHVNNRKRKKLLMNWYE